MKTTLIMLVAGLSLVGCGGTVCDRLNAAQSSFFAGATECKVSGLTITKSGSCSDLSACSATEQTAIDTYASCISKAQPCTAGKESQAASDLTACSAALLTGGVSATCAASVK